MRDGTPGETRARLVLGGAYVTNFGALAASGPFLAVHLRVVGFSPEAVASLLAVLLLVRVVAIPFWTLIADRAGSIRGTLLLVSVGSFCAFGALLLEPRVGFVAVALVIFSVFRAPFGALLDALLLRDAAESFGAVRAWGTAGYAVSALVTGGLIAHDGSRAVVYVTTVLLGAAVGAAWMMGEGTAGASAPASESGSASASAAAAAGESRSGPRMGALLVLLLRRPRVVLLFAVALLQAMGLAPYDALFSDYLTKLGGATAAAVAVTIGAGAEFVFLVGAGRIVRRLGPERLLVVACVASVGRWAAIAVVTNPIALVAIQVLHALSFGAFYLASVKLMDRETPPALRASGQGIFGSFAFGIAGAVALGIAAVVERHVGLRGVFALAAGAAGLAAVGAGALVVTGKGAQVASP